MTRFQKQLLSYAVTFAIYASIINWQVALILMIGIGFHECGHLWAAKRLGFNNQGFYLFPFVGGIALTEGNYRRYSQKAFVAIMGPVFGLVLTAVAFGVFLLTGNLVIGQAASWMALINLFNLIPLSQSDGGQILESITFSYSEKIGVILMGISTVVAVVWLITIAPVLACLVAIFGGQYLVQVYKNYQLRAKGYGYMLTPLPKPQNRKELTYTILSYVGTSGLLALIYFGLKVWFHVDLYGLFQ